MKKILELLDFYYFRLKIAEKRRKFLFSTIQKKENYIAKIFKKKLGYDIDFNKKATTFNQKIQFRKLYDNNSLYSICADKYKVREYVKEKVGEEYLIPLYLVTDRLTVEQWKKLPNSFVAKANHNSGPVQIVKDKSKVDKREIIKELNNQLKLDYGVLTMEKWYSDIPRKIIIEELLNDEKREIIQDIKVHCFNDGVIGRYFFDICSRNSIEGDVYSVIYDENWNNLNFTNAILDKNSYEKPKNLKAIIEVCKKLSEDFDYVRVDLYNLNEKIYFGELTFAESGGFGKFTNEKWDYKFGEFWKQKKLTKENI